MKYRQLRFLLLSMFAMLCGTVFADEVTMAYIGTTTSNMTGENDAATMGLDATAWSVVGDKGANNNMPGLNKAGDFRLYWSADGGNTVTVESLTGATINNIAITFTGDDYSNVSVSVNGNAVSGSDGVYTIGASKFVLGNANTSNVQVRIKNIVINYSSGGTTDTRAATTVTLGDHATTAEAGNTIKLPTATVTANGGAIAGAQLTWTSSKTDVATIAGNAISCAAAGTTTITATYAGDANYKASSASFVLTVTAGAVTINNFQELQEKVTSASTPATINFNGVKVLFVSSSNAFLSDANGYGGLVYTKNHGLEAGQTLTGTINANITLYQGNAEITNFTKEGLTIGTTAIVPVEKTLSQVGNANQSTLITVKNLTYSTGEKDNLLSDGTNSVVFYDKFKTGVTLEDGKAYDVTGIVVLYNGKIELCPRTADDVVAAAEEPTEPAEFQPFEITNADMSGTFDTSKLPAGVTFAGTQRGDSHGYGNVTLTVPVNGAVKFTIGGCQYYSAGAFPVKNQAGETIATLDPKTATCYHQDGAAITYIYTGEADVLTFGSIQYLPYFKAEATEVSEAVITYKDQNGNVLGKKTVYEGDPIGEVPAEYESMLTIPEGKKFRGWVYASKVKIKATDTVNGDLSVNASVTDIELAPEVGSVQTYDLTSNIFYPEDHENFSVEGGAYYNNHGFSFDAGGSFKVNVTGKAQIVLTLCQYGNGTTITAYDTMGAVISNEIPAKADTDGGTTVINYEGPDGELTFEFAAQTYLHKVTVYNVSEFLEKDTESDYYIVPAGDAASLIMAINAASSEPNSKIFLPNGTYDLGESVLTTVSGNNVSIIGESMEGVIIKNAPATSQEGLGKADLLVNTGTGLYLQDLTLQNALDYYGAGSAGRAVTLHDQGTQTINKNVRHLSYQDTYYSHKVGGVYYFEGGEIHGCVDYMCGNGKAYFEGVKIVNEKRSSATISANSELYVYNNCVVENNADAYNFGRAWSDHPVCVWLNTTLLDNGEKLIATRWNPSGINCDYSKAGEYGTKDASGTDITPATNVVTFTKENTTLETILTADEAATYTIEYTLGSWAATAQQQAQQVEAPAAELKDGVISWTPANNGATAYAIFKNGEFLGITTGSSYIVETITDNAPRRADEADVYTIRAANARGGFGEPATVSTATGINAVKNGQLNGEDIYTLQGVRVNNATKGVYIVGGKKVVLK